MKLKTLDLTKPSFEANGKTYFVEAELSIQRSVYAEQCKIEIETSLAPGKQLKDWQKVYELANQTKFADIVVLAYNNLKGFKDFYEKKPPVLKLCACYLNTENEDRRVIDENLVNAKIDDWAEEGYTMQGFFALALTLIKNDIEHYKNIMADFSQLIQEFNQKVAKNGLNTPIKE